MWGTCQTSESSSAVPAFYLGDHVHAVLNQRAPPSLSGSQVLSEVKRTSVLDEKVTPHWIIGRLELTRGI